MLGLLDLKVPIQSDMPSKSKVKETEQVLSGTDSSLSGAAVAAAAAVASAAPRA
jgi:hypothetical protein